jgi:Na+-transporting NADH:ubiquinone oxidoreductase subunit NqrD
VKIITTILDIVTAFLRLLEGEGRNLRRSVMRMVWAVACIAMASLLILAAAGFLLLGIYQYLASQMSPAAAAFLVSLLTFLLALIFAGIAKRRTR